MKKFIEVLKSCGYNANFVKNKKEALELAKSFIKPNMSVGMGGSLSMEQIGLLDFLKNNKEITLYNQFESGISMDENLRRRKQGLIADMYVTGTNAVTKDGKLINVDGSGNRVAALNFGPTNVLLIIGKNKIVNTLEDGFERVKNVAAVKNVERLNQKAISFGKEPKYNVDNASNKFTWIKCDREEGRIIIILVDEDLGF